MDRKLASIIDHTLLKPEAESDQIRKLCMEAVEYGFYSVCINPAHVAFAAQILKDTKVKVCTVVGFPLGACTTRVKVFETSDAVINGAEEIDMVMNIGAFKEKNYALVEEDIRSVVHAAGSRIPVKVILENCLLEKEEIAIACNICKKAGAGFVKTSTGFNKSGADVEDIRIMRREAGSDMEVKAAGGIRDYGLALAMMEAGADRIGASDSVRLVSSDE
jgi:deoxyribose-phosphate aldolase